MQSSERSDFLVSVARRVALWGPIIVGFIGVVVALNAALTDEYVGAGVSLAASALAFGVVRYNFLRE